MKITADNPSALTALDRPNSYIGRSVPRPNMQRLMQGRATLMIAHRLSTVKNADRICVIEAGRVVEVGTHAALVKKKGLYARLARQQSLDGDTPTVETVS